MCKRAKGFFKQNGVPFREWDVETTDCGATKFKQLGGSGVPLITVGSEKRMGFDANRFMAAWKETQSTRARQASPRRYNGAAAAISEGKYSDFQKFAVDAVLECPAETGFR